MPYRCSSVETNISHQIYFKLMTFYFKATMCNIFVQTWHTFTQKTPTNNAPTLVSYIVPQNVVLLFMPHEIKLYKMDQKIHLCFFSFQNNNWIWSRLCQCERIRVKNCLLSDYHFPLIRHIPDSNSGPLLYKHTWPSSSLKRLYYSRHSKVNNRVARDWDTYNWRVSFTRLRCAPFKPLKTYNSVELSTTVHPSHCEERHVAYFRFATSFMETEDSERSAVF